MGSMMKMTPKTAADRLEDVLKGAAEVVGASWYRNKPATRKLLLKIMDESGLPTTVLVPEGTHELYDSFARTM